uniref:Uncharacterized protein n=1 Tax=Parascaris univalens TaxID=6257 RepID=A0A914ZTW4_PARUN
MEHLERRNATTTKPKAGKVMIIYEEVVSRSRWKKPRKSKTRKRYASVRGDKEVGSSMSTRINFNDIKGIERASSFRLYYIVSVVFNYFSRFFFFLLILRFLKFS